MFEVMEKGSVGKVCISNRSGQASDVQGFEKEERARPDLLLLRYGF